VYDWSMIFATQIVLVQVLSGGSKKPWCAQPYVKGKAFLEKTLLEEEEKKVALLVD